jgi:hypothetical protein
VTGCWGVVLDGRRLQGAVTCRTKNREETEPTRKAVCRNTGWRLVTVKAEVGMPLESSSCWQAAARCGDLQEKSKQKQAHRKSIV